MHVYVIMDTQQVFFPIQRGVRQGCPISPYLFILCAEVLALKITSSEVMRGISIGNYEFKLLQYADDTVFFLDGSRDSLQETLTILDEFGRVSGLKVNLPKCFLFPLSPFRTTRPAFLSCFRPIFQLCLALYNC